FGWSVEARARRRLESKVPGTVRHWTRLLTRPEYREQHRERLRLRAIPGGQPTTTTLLGRPFEVLDVPPFLEDKPLLFYHEMYRFPTTAEVPRIIDCGASIGLGVCYFKHLYPESEIVAFEPDPRVFEVLKRNCASWGSDGIRLIPKAVWTRETMVAFRRNGS